MASLSAIFVVWSTVQKQAAVIGQKDGLDDIEVAFGLNVVVIPTRRTPSASSYLWTMQITHRSKRSMGSLA